MVTRRIIPDGGSKPRAGAGKPGDTHLRRIRITGSLVMIHPTTLNPADASPSSLEDSLTRFGTFGVLCAGLMALLMLAF